MKCEPKVMKYFSTIHTSFAINFVFSNNITILIGLSATGKTAAFSFIRECMAINPQIVCLNYLDYQKDIKEMLTQMKNKMIVIDNADILLDDETRKFISLDENNRKQEIIRICQFMCISDTITSNYGGIAYG